MKASLIKNEGTEAFRALNCYNKEIQEVKEVTVAVPEQYETKEPCEYRVSSVTAVEKTSGLIAIWEYGLKYTELSFTVTNTDDVSCSYAVELDVNGKTILRDTASLYSGEKDTFEKIYDNSGDEKVRAEANVIPEAKTVTKTRYIEKTESKVATKEVKYCH